MRIHLSPNDGVPVYLQIVQQVKYLVASGRRRRAIERPPIRTLAEQPLINPNTVARPTALEAAGVVARVAARAPTSRPPVRRWPGASAWTS